MKKRNHLLVAALCVSMVLVAALGAYIKYGVLKPLSLYQDKNIIELPFLLLSDTAMRETISDARNPEENPEPPHPDETKPGQTDPSQPVPGTEDPTGDPDSAETEPPTQPPTQPPQTDPPATSPSVPGFSFSGPAVDWSWFDDALFIGDSRTCGLRDYARSGNADYFCGVGMSSFNILKKTASDKRFGEQSLESLLSSKTYGKIFINLGINECGYPTGSLMKAYQKVVDLVRQKQPDAVIILQGIMNVGKKKASSASYFEPEHLAEINEKIRAIANGTDIFYIDVNEVFTDSDGYLLGTVSKDGCHLYAKYDEVWADWIRYAVAGIG